MKGSVVAGGVIDANDAIDVINGMNALILIYYILYWDSFYNYFS